MYTITVTRLPKESNEPHERFLLTRFPQLHGTAQTSATQSSDSWELAVSQLSESGVTASGVQSVEQQLKGNNTAVVQTD